MPDKSKTNKARKFRMMRPAQGQHVFGQPEGSVSTHISSVFEADGKYFVAPTITNKKAPYAGYQPQSFGEAYRAGEAIPFDSFDEAMQFSKTYKLPNIMKQYNNGGKAPKKKPSLLQYDPSSDAFGNPAYDLETYQKAITRDSLALEDILSPGPISKFFGLEENMFADYGVGSDLARQLQINRSNRDQIKGYTAKDIERMNYYMPEEPSTNFDAFLKSYEESGINDKAYGGKAANVDYEAEGGEVVIGDISVDKAYNGGIATKYKGANMYKLGGPSHAEGGIGIKMNTEEPSYVFSDRLNAGGNMTYATAASKFGSELDQINKMAMGGDVYDRNTAKLMNPRLMADVKDLYDDQEAYKKEQGIGQEPDKMFLGGLGMAMQFLPGALNVAKGLFGKKPKLDLGTYTPEEIQYQDFSPMQRSYESQQGQALAALKAGVAQSGASGSQLRANLQAGSSASQQQAAQFYGQLGSLQAQDKARVDNENTRQANQAQLINQQRRAQEAQFGMQNDPRQALGQGISQLAGTALGMGREKFQQGMLENIYGPMGGGNYGVGSSSPATPTMDWNNPGGGMWDNPYMQQGTGFELPR